MNVYVLTHHRNTPEEDFAYVVGVYAEDHLSVAREEMKRLSQNMMEDLAFVGIDGWDPDMCRDEPDYIGFGKPGIGYDSSTEYGWEIALMEVI